MRRSLLIVLVALSFPASATGTLPPDYDAAQSVALPRFLEHTATIYWRARKIELPRPVQALPPYDHVSGRAMIGQPRVWLHPSLLTVRSRYWRAMLCAVYVHERGHNAGLAHNADDPIMRATNTYAPPKCWRWAR